jgi:hypothetical protein
VTRNGLDFVAVELDGGPVLRAVVPGDRVLRDGVEQVEILSGLMAGDRILATVPVTGADHD